MKLLRDTLAMTLLTLLVAAIGTLWINLDVPGIWPTWIEPWWHVGGL